MDPELAALDAQLETDRPADLPDLAQHVRETATDWPETLPSAPMPQDEDDMDRMIFAALVSPFV
jgi:hypothetical protein